MEQVKMIEYDNQAKKIAVLADTHIPARARFIPGAVFKLLENVDLILHAGDLVDERVLHELESIAPVEAVAGNMDNILLKKRLGRYKLLKIGERKIGLLHGDNVIDGYRKIINAELVFQLFNSKDLDVVVFGHLHVPQVSYFRKTLFFNPGSPVDPRQGSNPSLGILTIKAQELAKEIIVL